MSSKILITKENGDQEPFDVSKLIQSLQRAGASEITTRTIVREVESMLRPGIRTRDIYKNAFSLLRKLEKPVAARYSLKRAVLELGPSGFPFEDFIGEIFKTKGYKVETRAHMMGRCVEHEIDFIARDEKTDIIGEAKFHNALGVKSDLKVAMYVAARIEDLKLKNINNSKKIEGLLVTNTKFTRSAIEYSECVSLRVISWTYPRFGNLQDLIEEARIHPLTCLTTLSKQEKTSLMAEGVVLCRSIEENRNAFTKAGITGNKLERVLEEGRMLCKPF